ncbi:hypothetical protein [Haloferula sp. BvORR071]|uniref:hypothetical protein n=1 Tax=Haloferula sp. BvORR071 TaxID=1396141 RepID=UPI0005577028|nr:hypothetical protein [Haloferula sp. BvORR071]
MSTAAAVSPAAPPPMDSHAAGRFDDFSDSLSPMLVKELRQGLRAKTFVIVFLALQALLAVVLLTAVGAASPERAGQSVSSTIFFFFSLAVLVVQPLRGVGALHNEIKGNTIDLMVLTRLGAWRIVLGKWVAIVSQSGLLLTAIVPYLILRYFFGGMNLFAELLLLALVFMGSAAFTALTVGLSAIGPILIRGLVPLGIAVGVTIGIFEIIFDSGLHELIEFCSLQRTGSMWVLMAAVLTGSYIGWIALAMGTAMIAPMAENHSTPRRVVAIAAVVLLGLFAWRGKFEDEEICSLLALYCVPAIAAALTERLELLPPICRPFLKYGAVGKLAGRVFYPGWPSGVLFTVLLLGISACVYLWVPSARPVSSIDPYRIMSQDIMMLAVVGTMLLPAVVLRIFSKKVKQDFAFYLLIAVILGAITLGLGMISDATDKDSYLWLFCWVPPVKMLLIELVKHDYKGGYGAGAGPNFTPVLMTGLITTGIYLFLLLLCAFRQFPVLREVEDEAEGLSSPRSNDEDSAEPMTP